MRNRVYIKVVVLLVVVAVLSLGMTALVAPKREDTDTVRIVTSFYPVYIAACNVASGIDGVQVINMVDSQSGCLHDYQMSPDDRKVLESADVFVMNGAGAEPFLESVLETIAVPVTVDLSEGQSLLESGHVHTHEHEHEHEHEAMTAVNSHLWVSPPRYRLQVETLADALAHADPDNAAQYATNAEAYIRSIDEVWARLQRVASSYTEVPTVLFHDSLAYLAEDLGLTVVTALNVGEESGVSAATLAEAEDALDGLEQAMFFYDAQYDAVQYTYLQEIPHKAFCLTVDTAVAGEEDPEAWIRAMTALCRDWEATA